MVNDVTQPRTLLHGEGSDPFAHAQLHVLSVLSNLRVIRRRPHPGAKGQLRPDSGRGPETRHDNARAHTESGVQPGLYLIESIGYAYRTGEF